MMKYTINHWFFLTLLICSFTAFGCMNDSDTQLSDIEKVYFEDYDSPQYKWGFINTDGDIAIKPKYDDVRDATSDLIAANLKGKWGYINLDGQIIIPHIYKQALDFSASRSFVQDFNNNWTLINEKGDSIKQMKYSNFKSFNGDYCIVEYGNKYGLIQNDGTEVLQLMYDNLKFIDSTFIVAKQFGKYGIINTAGKIVLAIEYERIYANHNDYWRCKKEGYQFYISHDLKQKSGNYSYANDFYIDKALVTQQDKFFLIDTNFKILKELPYSHVSPIGDGYFKYKEDDLYGILNHNGDIITVPKYELINNFKCDKVVFSQNDYFGYLNKQGNEVVPAILPLAWDYHNNMARVITRNGMGFINQDGKLVIEDKFVEVRDFNNGLSRFQSFR